MSEVDDGPAVAALTERLLSRFPGVPTSSVREVAAAAWAEATAAPVPEIVADLAERTAAESLAGYPLPPTADAADPSTTGP